jgi:hypothetical protein
MIRRMARENPLWGQERIANELPLKLGLRVSHDSPRRGSHLDAAVRVFRPRR